MSDRVDHERLAVLVHELRSPVAALSAIARTLSDRSAQATERDELVRLALGACRGLERIGLDVVATSVRREALDPGALVRDVVATARIRGVEVVAEVEGSLPSVWGDPVRLRQALDNLVANALVHSGTDAAVAVSAATGDDGVVLLSVADSGVGIPEHEQERIFDTGTRLDPNRPGSGLGLALVRAIAEAHGGRLSVVSAPGAGATFTIALPAG